jgi:hypothetical protein
MFGLQHGNGFKSMAKIIRASIEEAMLVKTFAIPGATPRPLLFQGAVPG